MSFCAFGHNLILVLKGIFSVCVAYYDLVLFQTV